MYASTAFRLLIIFKERGYTPNARLVALSCDTLLKLLAPPYPIVSPPDLPIPCVSRTFICVASSETYWIQRKSLDYPLHHIRKINSLLDTNKHNSEHTCLTCKSASFLILTSTRRASSGPWPCVLFQ